MEKKDKSVEEVENNETIDETQNESLEQDLEAVVEESQEDAVEEQKSSEKKDATQLEKELGEMKDKYLRIYAEFDNYRKRTIKEKQEVIKLAARDALNSLLPAVDDFKRAIKVANENENEAEIPEGIILIYDKLMKALEGQGLKEMESTGQDFDPDLHEALTKVPAPTDDLKGKVIDTIEQGYYLNDKIIRYAKVVVGE